MYGEQGDFKQWDNLEYLKFLLRIEKINPTKRINHMVTLIAELVGVIPSNMFHPFFIHIKLRTK